MNIWSDSLGCRSDVFFLSEKGYLSTDTTSTVHALWPCDCDWFINACTSGTLVMQRRFQI